MLVGPGLTILVLKLVLCGEYDDYEYSEENYNYYSEYYNGSEESFTFAAGTDMGSYNRYYLQHLEHPGTPHPAHFHDIQDALKKIMPGNKDFYRVEDTTLKVLGKRDMKSNILFIDASDISVFSGPEQTETIEYLETPIEAMRSLTFAPGLSVAVRSSTQVPLKITLKRLRHPTKLSQDFFNITHTKLQHPTRKSAQASLDITHTKLPHPTRTSTEASLDITHTKLQRPMKTSAKTSLDITNTKLQHPTITSTTASFDVTHTKLQHPTRRSIQESLNIIHTKLQHPTRTSAQVSLDITHTKLRHPTRSSTQAPLDITRTKLQHPMKTSAKTSLDITHTKLQHPTKKSTKTSLDITHTKLQPPTRTSIQESLSIIHTKLQHPTRTSAQVSLDITHTKLRQSKKTFTQILLKITQTNLRHPSRTSTHRLRSQPKIFFETQQELMLENELPILKPHHAIKKVSGKSSRLSSEIYGREFTDAPELPFPEETEIDDSLGTPTMTLRPLTYAKDVPAYERYPTRIPLNIAPTRLHTHSMEAPIGTSMKITRPRSLPLSTKTQILQNESLNHLPSKSTHDFRKSHLTFRGPTRSVNHSFINGTLGYVSKFIIYGPGDKILGYKIIKPINKTPSNFKTISYAKQKTIMGNKGPIFRVYNAKLKGTTYTSKPPYPEIINSVENQDTLTMDPRPLTYIHELPINERSPTHTPLKITHTKSLTHSTRTRVFGNKILSHVPSMTSHKSIIHTPLKSKTQTHPRTFTETDSLMFRDQHIRTKVLGKSSSESTEKFGFMFNDNNNNYEAETVAKAPQKIFRVNDTQTKVLDQATRKSSEVYNFTFLDTTDTFAHYPEETYSNTRHIQTSKFVARELTSVPEDPGDDKPLTYVPLKITHTRPLIHPTISLIHIISSNRSHAYVSKSMKRGKISSIKLRTSKKSRSRALSRSFVTVRGLMNKEDERWPQPSLSTEVSPTTTFGWLTTILELPVALTGEHFASTTELTATVLDSFESLSKTVRSTTAFYDGDDNNDQTTEWAYTIQFQDSNGERKLALRDNSSTLATVATTATVANANTVASTATGDSATIESTPTETSPYNGTSAGTGTTSPAKTNATTTKLTTNASATTINDTTETTTTTIKITTPTTTMFPGFDVDVFLNILANLTYDYDTNLTQVMNETLRKRPVPTCGRPKGWKPWMNWQNATFEPTTTTTEYYYESPKELNDSVIAKCFVCGLKEKGIPFNTDCADAFAGDFLPLVPVNPLAKAKATSYRKYCRYGEIYNFFENKTRPKTIYGRWTGGCSVRWTDLTGLYTQRTCRNRRRAVTGKHYASKRMAKLEMALSHVETGCIITPVATLLPLSRGISLFSRFHACVCTGNWCNGSAHAPPAAVLVLLLALAPAAGCANVRSC